MSDEFVPLGIVSLIAVIVVSIAVGAKGCNDSDNAVFTAAINKGCSMVHIPGGGNDLRCPGYKETKGF